MRLGRPGRGADAVRRRRRRRRLPVAALAMLGVLSPAIYSYAATMMRPSSLPLWPRSVEWLRAHHGNWIVDEVEHYYYTWQAPDPGGPQLKSLPAVGVGGASTGTTGARHATGYVPARIAS